jgi:'Cold-shock' DNA-binding domain
MTLQRHQHPRGGGDRVHGLPRQIKLLRRPQRVNREPLFRVRGRAGPSPRQTSGSLLTLVSSDRGGKDIFVHASALDRAGIAGLMEGQRVAVE